MLTRTTTVRALHVSAPLPEQPHRAVRFRFGERLRSLRQSHRLTQMQLAAYLGIDRSYLSDVERGQKNMSLIFLDTVAKGFNISLSELLDGL